MEIHRPKTPRNHGSGSTGSSFDFHPVAVQDFPSSPMSRQVSSPSVKSMSRQVSCPSFGAGGATSPSSSFQLSQFVAGTGASSRGLSSERSMSERPVYERNLTDLSGFSSSEESPIQFKTQESTPTSETIASTIADTIIGLLKKQLDAMTGAVAQEAEKLLELSSTSLSGSMNRSKARCLSNRSKGSRKSQTLECLEEAAAERQMSKESQEQLPAPDESSVPMPVWRSDPPRQSPSSKLVDQPQLPSVVEESDIPAARDGTILSNGTPYCRQVSPGSKMSDGSRRVNLSIEDFQRQLQRAAVIPLEEEGEWTVTSYARKGHLPKSVAGAWRRQALILGRQFREQMEEEVAMAKSNMSFHGGLWWLRSITGVRSLSRPKRAACISACNIFLMIGILSCNLHLTAAVPKGMLSSVLNVAAVFSAALGLTIHHVCCKFSENCPTTGEQDAMLQSHSVAFGFTDAWLAVSRKRGWWLLLIWFTSIVAACASYVYKANAFSVPDHYWFIVTGSLHFVISSTIVCSLSMRVLHICSAMKISLISYMQQFAEPSVDFNEMVQEWNAIQIFTRTLSDGCAPSLACQVAMIPVMVGSALLQMLLTSTSFLDLFVTITPFFVLSGMPYFALVAAADTTMQCEQAAQVANSLLVSQLANPIAQNLLDFMSRCNLGFFINDMRISPAGVMKYTYVLAGVFVTVASTVMRR